MGVPLIANRRVACAALGGDLELAKEIYGVFKEHAFQLTYPQTAEKTGIPASTIWRWMQEEDWRTTKGSTRPLLKLQPRVSKTQTRFQKGIFSAFTFIAEWAISLEIPT